MDNIFYNIVSIVIGVILIGFGMVKIIKKPLSLGIISLIAGILFVGTGVGGFFVPKEYGFITILAMLAIAVVMIFVLLLIRTTKPIKEDWLWQRA